MENTENKFEGLFIIGYGLGGGFGGSRNFEVVQVDNQDEAEQYAFESACEEYDRYAGMHGLRSVGQIMTEEGIEDEDEAQEIYNEERESWLTYSANLYSKEYEKKVSGYHYHNPYQELTNSED